MVNLTVPDDIKAALLAGAAIILSISGGKDSDVMVKLVLEFMAEQKLSNEVILWHSHLGRAEWAETPAYVESIAQRYNLPLFVQFPAKNGIQVDLLDEIDKRRKAMDEKGQGDLPHWPSAPNRYCTKSMKESECDKFINNRFKRDRDVIVVMGLRDEESTARAKKPDCWERNNSAPTLNRKVLNWLPIRKLTLAEIWQEIGYSLPDLMNLQTKHRFYRDIGRKDVCATLEANFKAHVAYLRGNERLSCAFCVLAGLNDWHNAAEYMPELYREYVRREDETGFSFVDGYWLRDLRPDLLD